MANCTSASPMMSLSASAANQDTGRQRSGTIQSFFRDLNAAFQLKKEFRRVPTPSNPENRVRYYLGVGLQTPVPTAMFDVY
jgi:hypothetical protein